METPVEIRYAGVVVARASEVRSPEGAPGLFLVVPDPLPVGTVIELGGEGARARVEKVVESADAGQAGMVVRPVEGDEALLVFTPPPRREPEPPPPPEPLVQSPGPVVVAIVEPTPAPMALAPPVAAAPPTPEPAAPEPEPEPPVVDAAAPDATTASVAPPEPPELHTGLAEAEPAVEPTPLSGDLPPARALPTTGRRGTRKRRK